MKQLYLFIFSIVLFTLACFKTNAQAEMGFSDTLQCADYTYCVDLEVNATAGNSFDVGTSSFLLTYDPAVVGYLSYIPVQFDATTAACPNVWAAQRMDVDALKGQFGLTMKLLDNTGSCRTVGETPSVIGTVCFNILTQGEIPNITFDVNNTRLNSSMPDNGTSAITLAAIDTLNVPNSLACDCPNVGAPCDDLNVFTVNDRYDNQCVCNGSLADVDVDGIYDGVDNCLDTFYEAEDGTVVGAQVKNNQSMYYGTGFVDYRNKNGDTLTLTIEIDSVGEYDLKLRYANASSDSLPRYLKFVMDTIVISESLAFPTTGTSWGDWSEVILTDSLSAGPHTMYLITTGKHGPNLDRISVSSCGNCLQAGMACDDNDPCTVSDTYDTNCDCKGVYKDIDEDGVCDTQDVCAGSDDNEDTDGDGIPDGCDPCDNNLIGTACDDNDPCTDNDVYDGSCHCVGTFVGEDTDMDGVCDAYDACPGYNDKKDEDGDGIPDDCDACNDLTVGFPCDDGNPCTVLDVIQPGCGCGGIPIYLELQKTIDSIDCHGGLANIDLTPEHMVGGVYFQWGNGAYTEDLNNVAPGTYVVTATDWRECSVVETITISQPAPLEMSFAMVHSNGSNGEASVMATGGTAPYIYSWDTGDSVQQITDLPSDRYYVTITDSLNCMANGFAEVLVDTMCVDTVLQYEYGEKVNMQTVNYDFGPAMDGYIRLGHQDDPSSVTHYPYFPDYGNYEFTIRYSHRNANRKVNIYLDTTLIYEELNLPLTGNDSTFKSVIFTIDSIPPGTHAIVTERWGTQNNQTRLDYLAVCKTASLNCNLVGTTCDDGDVCTVNDVIDSDCNCAGTYIDSDADGVCDGMDVCPGSPDSIDSDWDGIPDGCDDCHAYRYEAEEAYWSGPAKRTGGSGWSGTGYVDFRNRNNDVLRFTVDAPAAVQYDFNIRYAINASDRYLNVLVNDVQHIDSLYFPKTGVSNVAWEDLHFSAELCEGGNTISFITDGAHGPNIDYLSACLPGHLNQPVIAKGNGSFEEGASEWTRLHFWAAETTKIDVATDNVRCGSNSMAYTGAAAVEQLYTDIEALKIDSVYTLHFYAAGDSAVGYIGSPDFIYQGQMFEVDATAGNGDFVHHTVTFTATEPTMRVWFDLYENTPITFDAFSFDNAPCCNPNEDSDNDTVCDFLDVCPEMDDKQDSDFDGIPDGCDTCYDLIYQAELASFNHALTTDTEEGFVGNGYLDFSGVPIDTVSFMVNIPVEGEFSVSFRYLTLDTLGKVDVWIDGALELDDFTFAKTCHAWEYNSFVKYFTAGIHEIVLITTNEYMPNFDLLSLCLPGYFPEPIIADGNGGFEDGLQNWLTLTNYQKGSTQVKLDSNQVFCGLQSSHFQGDTVAHQLHAAIKHLVIDSVYTLHFYAVGDSANCYVGSFANVQDAAHGYVNAVAGAGEYVHQSVTFTATKTTMDFWLDLYPNSPMKVDHFSFDNALCCDTLNNGGMVYINTNPLASGVYTRDSSIQSSAYIDQSADVTYKATMEIDLQPDFEVKMGSQFLAVIEDFCNQPPAPFMIEEGNGEVVFEPVANTSFVEIKSTEQVKGFEVYDQLGNKALVGIGEKMDMSKMPSGMYEVLVVFENKPPVLMTFEK